MKSSNSLASREATVECTALELSSQISAENEIRFIYLTCHAISTRCREHLRRTHKQANTQTLRILMHKSYGI